MLRRAGLQALQRFRQCDVPAQQACFATATSSRSLFPDPSAMQGVDFPGDAEPGTVSGAPMEMIGREAYIYAPARTASQQGQAKTAGLRSKGPTWRIDFETEAKWQNPLIGWTSTADPLENVARASLQFHTKEQAVAFAIKNGYTPVVRDPQTRRPDRMKRYLGYGDNFSVKRHGYPIGGMRSESPMKKQEATEEMHMEPSELPPEDSKGEKAKPKAKRGRKKAEA